MNLISKKTDYAVRALMYLAREKDRVVPASEISKKENIPDKFLKRLLQVLLKKGYLTSKEGKGGGVILRKKPGEIKMLDIMRTFHGDFQISQCMFRKDICPNRKSCVLRAKVKVIEKDLENKFGEISILSLIAGKEN